MQLLQFKVSIGISRNRRTPDQRAIEDCSHIQQTVVLLCKYVKNVIKRSEVIVDIFVLFYFNSKKFS